MASLSPSSGVIIASKSSSSSSSLMCGQRSSPCSLGFMSFRNVLLALIAMQITFLIAIGFSAPPDESIALEDFLQPAEDALEAVLSSLSLAETASLSRRGAGGTRTVAIKSLDESVARWKKLSDEWEQQVGPYDTPGARTQNFLPERRHPSFRQSMMPTEEELNEAAERSIKLLLSKELPADTQITPCQYYKAIAHERNESQSSSSSLRILTREECQPQRHYQQNPSRHGREHTIVAYNSMPFDRTWCNKTVKAHSIQQFDTICEEPVQLFPLPSMKQAKAVANKHDASTPPIRLIRSGAPLANATTPLPCDIPCEATRDECNAGSAEMCMPDVSTWTIDGTEMSFTYSMMTQAQNGNLAVDRKAYRLGHYYATRSFQSEVPLSYFTWERFGTVSPAVDYDNVEKAVSFFKSKQCRGGGGSGIRADVWANATAQAIRVDSYGSCFHNTDLPVDGMSLDNPLDRRWLLERYLFHLVIDGSTDPDFVDEAVWEALAAGVIPVYYGASNIKEHVPPNSIISASDYGTKVATAQRIREVANDRALWETYHEWRKHPFPQELKAKYDFLHTPPLCRMCRWAHAKIHGLGWNHERQRVTDKQMNGRLCFTKRGALKHPFAETWMTPTLSRPPLGNCNWNWPHNATISATDMNINRTAHQHDGVIDLNVHQLSHSEGTLILRLEFETIQNAEGASFGNVHQQIVSNRVALTTSVAIQDDQSRVTVLCDWPTKVSSPSAGIIHIEVQTNGEMELLRDESRRIRVIPEDIEPLRDVITEYSMSPYSKRLMEDFLNPLELFVVKA